MDQIRTLENERCGTRPSRVLAAATPLTPRQFGRLTPKIPTRKTDAWGTHLPFTASAQPGVAEAGNEREENPRAAHKKRERALGYKGAGRARHKVRCRGRSEGTAGSGSATGRKASGLACDFFITRGGVGAT
jgi:hypothetical protein